jgi:hypothetical protein
MHPDSVVKFKYLGMTLPCNIAFTRAIGSRQINWIWVRHTDYLVRQVT